MERQGHLFTPRFIRLCICTFLFFGSFNMIIPELPEYLEMLGGKEYLGLIIALFTVTAGASRPFSGKLADSIGRVPVMVIGAVVSAICGLAYAFVGSVFLFLALRLLHGFSTGFTPTGNSAYVADIVPSNRRGEGMGIVSLAGSLGMAAGPAIGSTIALHCGYDAMFFTSSGLGILAFLLINSMPETLVNKQKFHAGLLRIRRDEFYDPGVLAPAAVLLFVTISFGTTVTLVPDLCKHLGLENKGLFFTAFTLASVTVRFGAGRISDRIGREKVLLVSTTFLIAAMLVIGNAPSIPWLILGAILFGLAYGMSSPTTMAWAIDLGDGNRVGRSMSTVYIALEIGIGFGALAAGIAYQGKIEYLPWIFGGAALCNAMAFPVLIRKMRRD